MIGDGMALAQITAGIYWIGNGKTSFEYFNVTGFPLPAIHTTTWSQILPQALQHFPVAKKRPTEQSVYFLLTTSHVPELCTPSNWKAWPPELL